MGRVRESDREKERKESINGTKKVNRNDVERNKHFLPEYNKQSR